MFEQMHPQAQIAIVMPNTLSCLGLKNLLRTMMPKAEARLFSNFNDFNQEGADDYFHYFISAEILLQHVDYFTTRRHKTIVLVHGGDAVNVPNNFHTLDVFLPEEDMIRSFLRLEQAAHGFHKPQPQAVKQAQTAAVTLTPREKEVLKLLVSGYINKEIADQLNVSLTTIISHRKNLTEKLHTKSVSALTIYAVMHGLVKVEEI